MNDDEERGNGRGVRGRPPRGGGAFGPIRREGPGPEAGRGHNLLPNGVNARIGARNGGDFLRRHHVGVNGHLAGRGRGRGQPALVEANGRQYPELLQRQPRDAQQRGGQYLGPERRGGGGAGGGRGRGDTGRGCTGRVGFRREGGRDAVHRKAPLNFGRLMRLVAETEPNKLLIAIDSNGFFDLMETPSAEHMREDLIALIIRALAKAASGDSRQYRNHFMAKVYQRKDFFTSRLLFYIASILDFADKSKRNSRDHLQAVSDLVSFVQSSQQTIPKSSSNFLSLILPILGEKILFLNARGYGLSQETVTLFAQIKTEHDKICGLGLKEREEAEKVEREQSVLPPDDFRMVTVCPNFEDIHGKEKTVFLRPNIAKGSYFDAQHYLDVQFRLLREDFVRPLREGIKEYLNLLKEGKKIPKNLKSLRLYSVVHILKSEMKNNGIVHNAIFDVTPFKHLRWQFNKRLLPGSLLCLTWDDFQTFCFASVAGKREAENLSKGKFQLRFEDINPDIVARITPTVTLTMVESLSYFEAYRYNLETLQNFKVNEFPLKKYLVDVEKEMNPPPYLTVDSIYDFVDFLVPLGKASSNSVCKEPRTPLYGSVSLCEEPKIPLDRISRMAKLFERWKISPKNSRRLNNVEVLRNEFWPTNDDLGLDVSQYAAFRGALTKQLSIIQGPPGTGKTYVGLRIVQVLLRNKAIWQGDKKSPILIVCCTNHALDQFLEGMLPFTKKIVRVGGRSQSTLLENYTLFNLRRSKQIERVVDPFIYENLRGSFTQIRNCQEKVQQLEDLIVNSFKKVLGNDLLDVIRECNANQFASFRYIDPNFQANFDSVLKNWFGFESTSGAGFGMDFYAEQGEEEEEAATDGQINGAVKEGNENEAFLMMDEEMVDEEEIKYITDQRIVDDYEDEVFFPKVEIKKGKKKRGDHWKEQDEQRRQIQIEIIRQLMREDRMAEEEAENVYNVLELQYEDRWRLYRYWRQKYAEAAEAEMRRLKEAYKEEVVNYHLLQSEEDFDVMQGCTIIGMTTTGAAKYRNVIDEVKPRIVVVEEAAEVLEAHIITSLSYQTDHLILIGDHQQLKPNPTVYKLAKDFNLDISLFERLIKNGIDYNQLKVQHRMRPCIASLLVPHVYPELQNHESVHLYEDIKGITKSMYFINHTENEQQENDTKSHSNTYEGDFVVRLALYLLMQGYKPEQITILTTYSGQLFHIRSVMKTVMMLKGVRATVVDNFQGEESDIIIISFVRSNVEGQIGFLKVSNRVNVALSRAKKGLYCIGNFFCLAENSKLWKNITKDLREQNAIGESLELYCQNHKETKTLVAKAIDFIQVPEGGCLAPCSFRLSCGHVCPRTCHNYDVDHKEVTCYKTCNEIICELKHRCRKNCHFDEECGNCLVKVVKTHPLCGHEVTTECSTDPISVHCGKPCEKSLTCGHPCLLTCGSDCAKGRCLQKMDVAADCGHEVNAKCYQLRYGSEVSSLCTESCDAMLACEHKCSGTCGKCQQDRFHVKCKDKCGRTLPCGHICNDPCSKECPPCKQKCQNRCSHSKCNSPCGALCVPCKELCDWKCEHKSCSQLCCESCDRGPCLRPCPKKLKCRHNCIGLCGEPCPKKCRICHKEEVEEIFFGNEDEEGSVFVQLQDCDHFFEMQGLRRWLVSDAGEDGDSRQLKLKECPKCKTIIRKNRLFNNVIQQTLSDINKIKEKLIGNYADNRRKASALKFKIELKMGSEGFVNHEDMRRKIKDIYEKLLEKVSSEYNKTTSLLNFIENAFTLWEAFVDIYQKLSKANASNWPLIEELRRKSETRLYKLVSALLSIDSGFAIQQSADFGAEVNALKLFSQSLELGSKICVNEESRKAFASAFDVGFKPGRLTDETKAEFKEKIQEASKHASGLPISLEEKQMVLTAMSLAKGHWYHCPNGHIYCITECGGATMESRCPDCGSLIGGGSHRLRSDNRVATVMDGAAHGAWSEFNNMNNFDPIQFRD